jgi:hypothetical protein
MDERGQADEAVRTSGSSSASWQVVQQVARSDASGDRNPIRALFVLS